MRRALLVSATAVLAGCTTVPPSEGLAYARIGQEIRVDGPRVTPLSVLEDSRCPENARCIWAGRVRISARIVTGRGAETREMTLGEPIAVADGKLLLGDVQPGRKTTEAAVAPGDYRFEFRFDGGV